MKPDHRAGGQNKNITETTKTASTVSGYNSSDIHRPLPSSDKTDDVGKESDADSNRLGDRTEGSKAHLS